MNFNYDIKFTDNTPQLHEALDSWAERVLTIWGMKVQDYARLLVPTGTADSTGIKDAGERQAAIAANADLFTGGGKD